MVRVQDNSVFEPHVVLQEGSEQEQSSSVHSSDSESESDQEDEEKDDDDQDDDDDDESNDDDVPEDCIVNILDETDSDSDWKMVF